MRPAQTLLAIKAIALMPGLSVSDRRVAVAIIDHFNRRDGRCDPGIDCLARELGIDRGTVIRSVRKLDRLEVVFKGRFQGRHRTNSYEPNWVKLNAFLDSRRADNRRPTVANPSTEGGQSGRAEGDRPTTQTCTKNLSEEPVGGTAPQNSLPHGQRMLSDGQARRENILRYNRSAPQALSFQDSAEQSAIERWDGDLRAHDVVVYERIVGAVTDEGVQAITAAEIRQRGGGLRYILDHLEELLHPEGGGHD